MKNENDESRRVVESVPLVFVYDGMNDELFDWRNRPMLRFETLSTASFLTQPLRLFVRRCRYVGSPWRGKISVADDAEFGCPTDFPRDVPYPRASVSNNFVWIHEKITRKPFSMT